MDLSSHVEQIHSIVKGLTINRVKSYIDLLHQCRLQIDPILFNSLRSIYGATLKNFWNTATIPKISNRAILFVERRYAPNLEFCLHNAVYFARGYSVHIFCSEANYEFIKIICGIHVSNIHIHVLFKTIGTPEEGKLEYNALLKQFRFWNIFQEEYILTMETDCYLLKPIPESIYKYDYVASRWKWSQNEPGGGGLTHRKTSIMKQICKLENKELQQNPMQDCFASTGITIINGITPNLNDSEEYFTESQFSSKIIGTHQWWTFIHNGMDAIKYQIEFYLTLNITADSSVT